VFQEDAAPVLFRTNLGLPMLQDRMADYINGLYTLDPFHRMTVEHKSGLFRMSDIMPEAFFQSEYFNHFYKHTSVYDELRYVVRARPDTSIHVFIEREGAGNHFVADEVRTLEALEPFIRAYVEMQALWQAEIGMEAAFRQRFDLREKIRVMRSGLLTPREIDTIELMLKGHSTKSMARVLGIDDGTVANHKRNIYAKLEVHSQAQLFNLFLRSLTEGNN